MGKKRAAYRALVEKPKKKKKKNTNWKPKHGRQDKKDLQEVGWGA
jgi:hypothetical protein